jgi:hypothetical protein
MQRPFRALLAAVAGGTVLLASQASAATIATFADPSDGTKPVFVFTSDGQKGLLFGGWSDPGLRLLTPGLSGDPEYPDAKFVLVGIPVTHPPTGGVAATRLTQELWSLGSGMIDFFDKNDQFLFRITFASGLLLTPQGFGGSDFNDNNVRFSGPIVPDGLFDEAFSFSFANPSGNFENYTVTSSFTSSAVPEPASLGLLLIGALGALWRGR